MNTFAPETPLDGLSGSQFISARGSEVCQAKREIDEQAISGILS